jgi:hypothetical protein
MLRLLVLAGEGTILSVWIEVSGWIWPDARNEVRGSYDAPIPSYTQLTAGT